MARLANNFTPRCPGCKKLMGLVSGKAIYYLDKSKHSSNYYVCTTCNTEIKCKKDSLIPMGKPADGTLKMERNWVGNKVDAMVQGKVRRDKVSEEAATEAAWKWVSKIVKKKVEAPEELDVPEMSLLIPELRKFD